jgi:membrane fusion protein (multidrug efflux system)
VHFEKTLPSIVTNFPIAKASSRVGAEKMTMLTKLIIDSRGRGVTTADDGDVIPVRREPDALPRDMARTRRMLALVTLALVLCGGASWYGVDWWTTGRFVEDTDDAYVGGNVTAISPHVAGFVTAILVADNQYVRAGQSLVTMDKRDFQAAYDRARSIASARAATLASLQARYIQQKSTIDQAAADVDAKIAQSEFAHEDAVRYASLATTSAGSRQDAQKSAANDRSSVAAVSASQASLEAARQELNVLEARIVEARAAIDQADAEVRTARLNLGYTDIASPIDGYIGNRSAQVGAYVSEGAYLLSVIPSYGLWVDANFKEDQLERMHPGQAASVVADIAPGRVFHGRVMSLAPGTGAVFSVIPAENATGNFTKIVQRVPVRIGLDANEGIPDILRPGLSTTVRVDTRGPR